METYSLITCFHLTLLCGAVLQILFTTGCSAPPLSTEGYPSQAAMRGKTRAEILSCAGPPIHEIRNGPVTELRYFRKASILEESGTASKGSSPGVHHGCWVSVMVQDDRVEAVHYRFVPDFVDASDDCEEILSNCGSP